jgi:hypothetical protein
MRTVLLGLLGLVLAVAVGLGVHVVTRGTISLPVVQLEQGGPLAPPTTTTGEEPEPTGRRTTTAETGTEDGRTAETDDGSGRGRGRGRSGGGDDDD